MNCILDFSQLPEKPPYPDSSVFAPSALLYPSPLQQQQQQHQSDLSPSQLASSQAAGDRSYYSSQRRQHGQQQEEIWYVLLLLANAHNGHTQIIKTTNIEPWLPATTNDDAAGNSSSSGAELLDTDTEPSPAGWRAAVIIEAGPDEAFANRIISMISINSKGKQVRGVLQRGARADLVATQHTKRHAIDWQAALNLTPEEYALLRITNYRL